MMFGYGYGMGWMWLWGLLALAGLVVLVFVIVRLAAGGATRDHARDPGATGARVEGKRMPREILDERYAKGELTTEEYQERLRVLGDNG
ncbi:MAG: SHOCT domain-containing protein [Terrimesophilobacter sp.]